MPLGLCHRGGGWVGPNVEQALSGPAPGSWHQRACNMHVALQVLTPRPWEWTVPGRLGPDGAQACASPAHPSALFPDQLVLTHVSVQDPQAGTHVHAAAGTDNVSAFMHKKEEAATMTEVAWWLRHPSLCPTKYTASPAAMTFPARGARDCLSR